MLNFAGILRQAASKFPVDEWTFQGMPIWPVLCGLVHNCHGFSAQEHQASPTTATVKGRARELTKLQHAWQPLQSYWTYLRTNPNAKRTLGKAEILFLSDGVSRTQVAGQYYENFFSFLIQQAKTEALSYQVFDPGNGLAQVPTHESTVMLSSRRYWIYLQARFLGSKQVPTWPQYVDFLAYVAHHLGVAYQARLQPARVLQDLKETLLWRDYWLRTLDATGARKAYILAYYSPLGWGLCHACADKQIPAIDVQHGIISDQMAPYCAVVSDASTCQPAVPSVFRVWTPGEQQILDRFLQGNPHHQVEVSGNDLIKSVDCMPATGYEAQLQRLSQAADVNILIAHQYPIEWQDCLTPIAKLIQQYPNWTFWLRKHPCHSKTGALGPLAGLKCGNFVDAEWVTELPLPILLKHMDLIVSQNSSVANVGLNFNLKTIFIHDSALATKQDLIDAAQAVYLQSQAEILQQILQWCPQVV